MILVVINIVKAVAKLFLKRTMKVFAVISAHFGFISAVLDLMKVTSITFVIIPKQIGLVHHVYENFIYLVI